MTISMNFHEVKEVVITKTKTYKDKNGSFQSFDIIIKDKKHEEIIGIFGKKIKITSEQKEQQ